MLGKPVLNHKKYNLRRKENDEIPKKNPFIYVSLLFVWLPTPAFKSVFYLYRLFFSISRFHIILFRSIFRSFQIKSYNQFKLMSRSTMGTSKSHIGQSVGTGGKFRNQIYASCNLKIPQG